MSCPGLLGLPRASSALTPASFAAELAALAGATLVGLWLGDDAVVDGSNNVLSVTGRVGGDATSVGASYLTRVALNGRYFLANTQVATTVALRTAILTAFYIFSVQRVRELPFVKYHSAIASTGPAVDKSALIGSANTSNWHEVLGWWHYEPYGVHNAAVPTGVHMTRSMSNTVGGDTDTWDIGGRIYNGAGRNFAGDIGLVAMVNALPSSEVDASITALLKSYYSIA